MQWSFFIEMTYYVYWKKKNGGKILKKKIKVTRSEAKITPPQIYHFFL